MGKSVCLLYNTLGLRYSYIGLCFACAVAYLLVFSVSFLWMEAHPENYEKSIMPVQPEDSSTNEEDGTPENTELTSLWQ